MISKGLLVTSQLNRTVREYNGTTGAFAHDFDSGDEIGSVSAASSAFSAYIGEQFKRVADKLTIG